MVFLVGVHVLEIENAEEVGLHEDVDYPWAYLERCCGEEIEGTEEWELDVGIEMQNPNIPGSWVPLDIPLVQVLLPLMDVFLGVCECLFDIRIIPFPPNSQPDNFNKLDELVDVLMHIIEVHGVRAILGDILSMAFDNIVGLPSL